MFALLVFYARFDKRLRAARLFSRPPVFDRATFSEIWRLGFPIGLTIAVEVANFAIAALAMGLIGATSIAAHAIVLQLAGIAFMVPLGLGQAASVRVGHAFGARDRKGVARAGWAGLALSLMFVAGSATVMFCFPNWLIAPFLRSDAVEHAEIAALALSFLRVAALFQIFDGAQAALANMLRGVQDSRVPAALAILGYWLIGTPVGFALAFLTPLKGLGLWIGLAVGLAAVAMLLLARWLQRERYGFFA